MQNISNFFGAIMLVAGISFTAFISWLTHIEWKMADKEQKVMFRTSFSLMIFFTIAFILQMLYGN